jgi:hypothetical protein
MIARLSTVSLHVAVARGDPPALAMVRAMENEWYRDPMLAMISGGCGADLLRWREEPRAALELAERTLEYVEHSWPLFLGAIWLSALGLAAAGDLAEHARLVHDESELTGALDAGERLFAQARNVAREGSPRGGVLGPEGRAWLLRAEAEYSRVAGASDVDASGFAGGHVDLAADRRDLEGHGLADVERTLERIPLRRRRRRQRQHARAEDRQARQHEPPA